MKHTHINVCDSSDGIFGIKWGAVAETKSIESSLLTVPIQNVEVLVLICFRRWRFGHFQSPGSEKCHTWSISTPGVHPHPSALFERRLHFLRRNNHLQSFCADTGRVYASYRWSAQSSACCRCHSYGAQHYWWHTIRIRQSSCPSEVPHTLLVEWHRRSACQRFNQIHSEFGTPSCLAYIWCVDAFTVSGHN